MIDVSPYSKMQSPAEQPPAISTMGAGVVSADTISHLHPYVPLYRRPHSRARNRLLRQRGVSIRRGSGWNHVVLTAVSLLASDLLACLSVLAVVQYLASSLFALNATSQFVSLAVAYTTIGWVHGLFPATAISPVLELRQLIVSALLSFGLIATCEIHAAGAVSPTATVLIASALLACILLPVSRAVTRKLFCKFSWWGERAIIIGSGVQGRAIYNFYFSNPQRGLKPIGIVDQANANHGTKPNVRLGRELSSTIPYLGSISRLSKIANRYSVRWGIVAPGGCEGMDSLEVINCSGTLPHVLILPSQYSLPSLWTASRECAGVLGIHISDGLQSSFGQVIKRAFDVVVAGTVMLLFCPFVAIIWVFIKFASPGPVFFGQKRIGRGGQPFMAWKFRTMVENAEQVLEEHLEKDVELRQEWMIYQKLRNDPRVIPGVGNFLRKSSLDEIPQLWNVLMGQMSLVGPRPCVSSQIGFYKNSYPLYVRVRPGLTGLWQVSGRNHTSYEQRVRFDAYYVCNWSIWLDFFILLRTVKTIAFREGAY